MPVPASPSRPTCVDCRHPAHYGCQQPLANGCWRAAPGADPGPMGERPMAASSYDVIVVGARVAGAATALLLARRGLRVLAVDQAAFPSDTLSSHQVQLPGVARLARWGLLGRLTAAATPPTHR